MRRVRINHADLEPKMVACAAIRRGLAISRSQFDSQYWSITHMASGRRMTSLSPDMPLGVARRVLALLAETMDWRLFPSDPWNLPASNQEELLAFTRTVAEMFEVEW